MLTIPPSPRITSGELKNGTATLYIADSGLESITNYAYSTNEVNYTSDINSETFKTIWKYKSNK